MLKKDVPEASSKKPAAGNNLMKTKYFFFCALLILTAASCDREKPLSDYGKKFAEAMKTSDGMFRGTELGKNLKEVKALEGIIKPKDEDVNYLYYEFPGDTGELYTVEYNFDERGLNEVKMDAYFVSPADAHSLFVSFRDYYTTKYGATEKFDGFAAWAFKMKDGKTEQIELSDESAEYRQGKFSLIMYYVPDDQLRKPANK